jgi:hypothetical protein
MTTILKLSGGLGNQIFQYGAAKALANSLKSPLLIDLDWFDQTPSESTPRQEMLSQLRIHTKFIHSNGNPFSLPELQIPLPRQIIQKLKGKKLIYKEKKSFFYQESLFRQEAPIYLEGYWQSFKYLSPIRQILLNEIQPKQTLSQEARAYLDQINACENAIMLHIRRGDYVSQVTANQFHGVLPLAYYQKALLNLRDLIAPEVFVFSDDITWAKEHLSLGVKTTYIQDIPGEYAVVEELHLMKHCQHHIIANSSLSWFGAWLCEKSGQKVFAPKQWLIKESFPMDDLIPTSWNLVV